MIFTIDEMLIERTTAVLKTALDNINALDSEGIGCTHDRDRFLVNEVLQVYETLAYQIPKRVPEETITLTPEEFHKLSDGFVKNYPGITPTHYYGKRIIVKPVNPEYQSTSPHITEETICQCGHVIQACYVLYGTKAFTKCPQCGQFLNLKTKGPA